jgi:hypothetical protein
VQGRDYAATSLSGSQQLQDMVEGYQRTQAVATL